MLVDLADAQRIGGRRLSIGSHGYAQLCVPGGRVALLHRWLLDLKPGDGLLGDHIDGNKLNNRRSNLRVVNASGSSQNVAGRGRSRYRGVVPTRQGRWMALVKFQGVTYRLGTYDAEIDAARVADLKRRELMPDYRPRPADTVIIWGSEDPSAYLPNPRRQVKPLSRPRKPLAEVISAYVPLRQAGASRREIADRIGMTRVALYGALRRARLAGDSRIDYQPRRKPDQQAA